ncbi:hypothetical protein [Rhizobium leguminosarum]|uniref:hypothetical protein n=1 Tax=Rhizobium leguminosarum TaxID=384 RepID=UPI00102FC769|nr:hypothetical protein [Rhizobium leguminosarum]TBF89114.1 hypothetical protein ELG82_36835 [Rhizobium leguminosarum]
MTELRDDFFEVMRGLKAEPSKPISLLEFGPPLVGEGHQQEQIADVLFRLEREGVIRLLAGNRFELTKPRV